MTHLHIMRLGVCVPSMGQWRAEFGQCIVNLWGYTLTHPLPGFDGVTLQLFHGISSILPKLRQDIVNQAIDAGVTHLLLLDTDMIFPADLVHKLYKHNKEIVISNCTHKCHPPLSTAALLGEDGKLYPLEPKQDVSGLH